MTSVFHLRSALLCRAVMSAALLSGLVFSVVAPGTAQAQQKPNALVHKPAPGFIRKDLAGKSINLRSYRGKVVLLNFWATWCGPCQVELPRFSQWQKELGPTGLQVITVSMDDDAAPVRRVIRKLRLQVPVIMGDPRLGTLYGGVLGLPVTYLIARNGTITERIEGGADLPTLEKQIRTLLAKP
jgi:cytochrome c biogenesis protein CcmG/thiol:disulfide interchange protein DsbE